MSRQEPPVIEASASTAGTVVPAGLCGFDREDLETIAEGLDSYERTVNVGNVTGEGEERLESTTAAAARFISVALGSECPDPRGCLASGCNQTRDGSPCHRFVEPAIQGESSETAAEPVVLTDGAREPGFYWMLEAPDSVEEAMDFIQLAVEFAYKQGLHEVGYDPVAVIRTALGVES